MQTFKDLNEKLNSLEKNEYAVLYTTKTPISYFTNCTLYSFNNINLYMDKVYGNKSPFDIIELHLRYIENDKEVKDKSKSTKFKDKVLEIESVDKDVDIFELLWGEYFCNKAIFKQPLSYEKRYDSVLKTMLLIPTEDKHRIRVIVRSEVFQRISADEKSSSRYFPSIENTLHIGATLNTNKNRLLTILATKIFYSLKKTVNTLSIAYGRLLTGFPLCKRSTCGLLFKKMQFFYGAISLEKYKDLGYFRKILKHALIDCKKINKTYSSYMKKNMENLTIEELEKNFNYQLWYHHIFLLKNFNTTFKRLNAINSPTLKNKIQLYRNINDEKRTKSQTSYCV